MHGGLPLYVWDESLGSTEEEVWTRVLLDDEWVLLDASFGLEASTDGAAVGVLPLKLGQEFDLIAPSDPGTAKTVRVAGFLAQSSLAFSPGVWANQSLVEERYDGAITRVYVSVDPSSPALEDDPQDVDVPPGKSEEERRAAAGVSEALDEALADEGVLVTLIVDDILLVQGLVLAILAIFQAYLALGWALVCSALAWSPRERFGIGPTSLGCFGRSGSQSDASGKASPVKWRGPVGSGCWLERSSA